MADQAKRANIRKVALASAFNHRDNVVRIPQRFTVDSRKTPVREQFFPVRASGPFQVKIGRTCVHVAQSADATIAYEHLLAKVAWVCAKPPFVHAPVGAEREPARRHFEIAPTAESAAILTFFERCPVGYTTRHGP